MSNILLYAIFAANTNLLNLPPGLLESVCYIESKHTVTAIHYRDGNEDSLGICQIKLSTAKFMGFKGTRKQLMDPQYNIYFAGKYLKHQIARYNGAVDKGIMAYNIGHAKHLTTSEYLVKVNKQWITSYGGLKKHEQWNRQYYSIVER